MKFEVTVEVTVSNEDITELEAREHLAAYFTAQGVHLTSITLLEKERKSKLGTVINLDDYRSEV